MFSKEMILEDLYEITKREKAIARIIKQGFPSDEFIDTLNRREEALYEAQQKVRGMFPQATMPNVLENALNFVEFDYRVSILEKKECYYITSFGKEKRVIADLLKWLDVKNDELDDMAENKPAQTYEEKIYVFKNRVIGFAYSELPAEEAKNELMKLNYEKMFADYSEIKGNVKNEQQEKYLFKNFVGSYFPNVLVDII